MPRQTRRQRRSRGADPRRSRSRHAPLTPVHRLQLEETDMKAARILILLALVFPSPPAIAQTDTGTAAIQGVVLDPDGRSVASAAVVIRPAGPGRTRTAI